MRGAWFDVTSVDSSSGRYVEVQAGRSVFVPSDDVQGGRVALRVPEHGESWTRFYVAPVLAGESPEEAAERVLDALGWGESYGGPGRAFFRSPSVQVVRGVVFVRWSGGLDV
jgi:hypothetical protein